MATDRERARRLRGERSRRARALPRLQRETDREIARLLGVAQRDVRAALAGAPSDFDAATLPALEASVRRAMDEFEAAAASAAAEGQRRAWTAGVETVDAPISAGLSLDRPDVDLADLLPEVDTRQLSAMQEFLTGRMRDVGARAANAINGELGLAIIGTRPAHEAVSRVADVLKSGRRRARTIVRTETARAYAVAGQQRLEQAAEILPGLEKEWRESGKVHARPTHAAANGQHVPVDEPFNIAGVALRYPVDPLGPPAETINCGCQSLPRMEHWEVAAGADGDPPVATPLKSLDDFVGAGSPIRDSLIAAAGGDVEAADFPERFRGALRARLRDERGAGSVEADIRPGQGGGRTAAAVRRAAALLPASWVRKANVSSIEALGGSGRGFYRNATATRPPRIAARNDSVALHEYIHHVQAMDRDLDALFVALHRRRTAGEPVVSVVPYSRTEVGREDGYILTYQGKEYEAKLGSDNDGKPLEVITMAMQMLFYKIDGEDFMEDLAAQDPEMLDLALGVLFRYDPS